MLGSPTGVGASESSDRRMLRRPPRMTAFDPRLVTRTLALGVLGELRVLGAHAPDLYLARNQLGEGWDLGGSYRLPQAG